MSSETDDQHGANAGPDSSAVRTALWRAFHLEADALPHVIEDEIGLKLIDPPKGWQERPDVKYTKRPRASIVARARFIEDLVDEEVKRGISQYVILGAGLDSLAERRTDLASCLQIFEIDQPRTLDWKRQRLVDTGLGVPLNLRFVPVDFETGSWWKELVRSGFDSSEPAVISCTGVSLYQTEEAIVSTLEQMANFASGSKLAMTFYLPMEHLDDEDRPMQEIANKGARESGTPFVSFFPPDRIVAMATEAGLKDPITISTKDMKDRYFADRSDGLTPASGEVFLVASI